jgi:hypothetical protein
LTPQRDPETHAQWKARLLRRLAVVTNADYTYHIRLAAIRSVQEMMGPDSSLCRESAERLLQRVLPPWAKRDYMDKPGPMTVKRPPQSVMDVWA